MISASANITVHMQAKFVCASFYPHNHQTEVDMRVGCSPFWVPLCLGTGTFGRVVLTREIPTDTFYALKIMSIADIVRLKQVEHVTSEKAILSLVSSPFIVNM